MSCTFFIETVYICACVYVRTISQMCTSVV